MSLLQRKDVRGNGAGGPEAQRAVGERGAGAAGRAAPSAPADPELVERPQRRRFSAEYKLRVLHEADGHGEVNLRAARENLNHADQEGAMRPPARHVAYAPRARGTGLAIL